MGSFLLLSKHKLDEKKKIYLVLYFTTLENFAWVEFGRCLIPDTGMGRCGVYYGVTLMKKQSALEDRLGIQSHVRQQKYGKVQSCPSCRIKTYLKTHYHSTKTNSCILFASQMVWIAILYQRRRKYLSRSNPVGCEPTMRIRQSGGGRLKSSRHDLAPLIVIGAITACFWTCKVSIKV